MRKLALVFWLLPPLVAAELLWGPYLQDVRADRASVLWATRGSAGVGSVRHFTADGSVDTPTVVQFLPASRSGLPQDVWLHRANLLGLQQATEYRYIVSLDGQPAASTPDLKFRTAGALPFRFLAIGDTGDNGAGQRLLAQSLNRETAAFLLHLGDIAYWDGTFIQYQQAFFEIYAQLLVHIPAFLTIGNHDATDGAYPYRTLFLSPRGEALYYSFDWANAHFTVLDSNASFTPKGPMLDWLEQDLANTRQTWRIVAIHHPPFPSTDYKRNDPICRRVLNELTPIFERHGVHLILSGHEHIYQRNQPRRAGAFLPQGPGAVYVTSGGGGSQNYDPGDDPYIAASASGPHYLRIDVTSSSLRAEVVDPYGKILDEFQLSPAPAILPAGIVDAASFGPALAPGGLVTLMGWNFTEPGSVSLTASGQSWPLLYTSRTQINAQIPFDTPSRSTLTLSTRNGAITAPVTTQPAAPALFAAAIHQDGRLVTASAPAATDEWISLYATGLGRLTAEIPAGKPAPASPLYETAAQVRVEIGTRLAEASQAVLAPGFFGLYQVNARIPRGLPAGPHNVQLLMTGAVSNKFPLEIR